MSLPVIMSSAEVAKYLDVSEATLERWRAANEGPQTVRIGVKHVDWESSVADYLNSQLTGSKAATPAQLQAALKYSNDEAKAARLERLRQMQALDNEDRESVEGVTPLTVSRVGETPGSKIEYINTVPSTPVVQPATPHFLNRR